MAKRTRPEDAAWSDYAGELATNLRRLRQEAGLSQEDVAYRSGLTRYTYQKYEKGESKPGTPANPTIRTLLAMSQALGVSLMDILPAKIPDLRLR
ncbi:MULTISPECIES: helix-turn-helix domain-containing protein [Bacteria]